MEETAKEKKKRRPPRPAGTTALGKMRISRRLPQGDFAKATGVSVETIQKLERGYRKIDGAKIKTLLTFAEVLGCRVSDILEQATARLAMRAYEDALSSKSAVWDEEPPF